MLFGNWYFAVHDSTSPMIHFVHYVFQLNSFSFSVIATDNLNWWTANWNGEKWKKKCISNKTHFVQFHSCCHSMCLVFVNTHTHTHTHTHKPIGDEIQHFCFLTNFQCGRSNVLSLNDVFRLSFISLLQLFRLHFLRVCQEYWAKNKWDSFNFLTWYISLIVDAIWHNCLTPFGVCWPIPTNKTSIYMERYFVLTNHSFIHLLAHPPGFIGLSIGSIHPSIVPIWIHNL